MHPTVWLLRCHNQSWASEDTASFSVVTTGEVILNASLDKTKSLVTLNIDIQAHLFTTYFQNVCDILYMVYYKCAHMHIFHALLIIWTSS